VGALARPDQRRQAAAQHAAEERDLAQGALERLVPGRPDGRRVAGQLDHRLVAERAWGTPRVRGVGYELRAAVLVRQLEQVLEAVGVRPRELERPGARRVA